MIIYEQCVTTKSYKPLLGFPSYNLDAVGDKDELITVQGQKVKVKVTARTSALCQWRYK